MSELPLMDMIAATVVFAAMIRGVWIGLVREGFSLAAIGLCTIVTRIFIDPMTEQITSFTEGEITGKAAVWIAGVLLVIGTILLCGLIAKLMKKGIQFAGLGWADRAGGGALGLAEGAIVAAVLVLITLWVVGPDHTWTQDARSVQIVEEWRVAIMDGELRDALPPVASPGEWF